MPSEQDNSRINDFVEHLLKNPNIKNEPILAAEGMLLGFIAQNRDQLRATFKTPQFFPHLEWTEVMTGIISNISDRVLAAISPMMDEIVENADFEVFNKLTKGTKFPVQFHRDKLNAFVRSILGNRDVRNNLNGVVNIFKYGIVEKYLKESFSRRDYLYNELVRVQKTYLEYGEYTVFFSRCCSLSETLHS
jgi:hypothetical protein